MTRLPLLAVRPAAAPRRVDPHADELREAEAFGEPRADVHVVRTPTLYDRAATFPSLNSGVAFAQDWSGSGRSSRAASAPRRASTGR